MVGKHTGVDHDDGDGGEVDDVGGDVDVDDDDYDDGCINSE